jgi:hypothetical protein
MRYIARRAERGRVDLLHRTLHVRAHANQLLDVRRPIANNAHSVLDLLSQGARIGRDCDRQGCPDDHKKALDHVFHLGALAPPRHEQ